VPVIGNGCFRHRAIHIPPFGEQLVKRFGIDNRAREDMGTNLRAFLEHDDLKLLIDLLEPDRCSQPSWSAADDHHVTWH